MKISVIREIKNNEFGVAMTPAGVRDLVTHRFCGRSLSSGAFEIHR